MEKVALAFVDDHPVLLDGLTRIFGALDDFEITAKGCCAADAIRLPSVERIDVVVLDLNMPGNAFEAIAAITSTFPHTKVVVFTASITIDHAVQALEAGANGYVIKGSTADELADAIRSVVNGQTFITPSFASKVINALSNPAVRNVAAQAIKLSIREEQVVRLLVRGRTNREIAQQLAISEKTVKHYMTVLMQKLNVRNRIEAVLAVQKLPTPNRELPPRLYPN